MSLANAVDEGLGVPARGSFWSARTNELLAEQRIPLPPDRVFAFFADPTNLERITPPFMHFQVLRASTPTIQEGTLIDYKLRVHGFPMRWRSRIECWKPGREFVDVQLRGPYRLWHHTHQFEPLDGGTLIRDRVRYRLPLGALGDLVAGTMVRKDVETIFAFREKAIREIFSKELSRK